MNNMVMNNVIKKIISGIEVDNIIECCKNDLYVNGPTNDTVLEILALCKELQPAIFLKHEIEIVNLMGLFFKENSDTKDSLKQLVLNCYKESIQKIRDAYFTPMQNEILSKIENNKNYSFSSPTSTGKSYIFKYIIQNAKNDIVIIVPSRALINEFYIDITDYLVDDSSTVLTFVEDINKKHTKRHIFILTPERARDILKLDRNRFKFDYFLFDEAQLTNQQDERGIYYDGIVRRLRINFPNTKFLFAHPFIKNPEVQFTKNGFDLNNCDSNSFRYKNTGQLFISEKDGEFYLFGLNENIMGKTKVKLDYDPIERVLSKKNGCILVYTSKSKIINKDIFEKYKKYINKCVENQNGNYEKAEIIEEIKPLIGADDDIKSYFVECLKNGIVFHHGSMPLDVRILLEKYIRKGFCKICFATSTLAQGINMPFDLIEVDRFEKTKKHLVRNLIGRSGRSSKKPVFDYGMVVIKDGKKKDLKKIIGYEEEMKKTSKLDSDDLDNEYVEFKNAIITNDFSDEFNFPNTIVDRVSKNNNIKEAIDYLEILVNAGENKIKPYLPFLKTIFIETINLKRDLTGYEETTLNEGNVLLLYRMNGQKFSEACRSIYSYAIKKTENSMYNHNFIPKYSQFPNSTINKPIPLFRDDEMVDFDSIVYNTYDFFDKLIDLKLTDIYYMALTKYADKYNSESIRNFAIKLKYGTSNEKEIMELRYGFSSSDFDWLSPTIENINEDEIIFNSKVDQLSDFQKSKIARFRH